MLKLFSLHAWQLFFSAANQGNRKHKHAETTVTVILTSFYTAANSHTRGVRRVGKWEKS